MKTLIYICKLQIHVFVINMYISLYIYTCKKLCVYIYIYAFRMIIWYGIVEV